MRQHQLDIGQTETPVTPIIIGESEATLEAGDHCMRNGVYLIATPFPIVPLGKARLRATTDELIARGGYGSPTMFVDKDDMYFGNDQLPIVEAALKRSAA